MKGFLTWVREKAGEKIEAIKTGVQQTYNYAVSTLYSITSKPYVRNFAYSFSIKFWVGATRPLDPGNVTKLFHSEKTRRALRESVKANIICYLGVAMTLELLRVQMVNAVATNDDESWFTVANSINMLYGLILRPVMMHRIFDNVFINMALAKSVVDENKLAEHLKHCNDDDGALLSAGAFSAVNAAFKSLTIGALSWVPVIGWIAPIARMHADGESFAEYPYSFVGMCTNHRAEALVKDNAYSLGIGFMSWFIRIPVSFFIGNSIPFLVYRSTGIEMNALSSSFMDDAIKSFLNTYFIVSVLLQDKPIPGDKNGIDFYQYHRLILQSVAKTVGEWIAVLEKGNLTTKWNWRKRFETVNEFKAIQAARWWFQIDFFYGNWSTSKTIVTNPSTTLFLHEYLPLIEQQLKNIIEMRGKYGKIVPILPEWLITFMKSEGYSKLIKIVFHERLDEVLKSAQNIVLEIDRLLIANTRAIFRVRNYKAIIENVQIDGHPAILEKVIEKPVEKKIEKPSASPVQDDQFFDVKEQKDVAVNKIQEEKKEVLAKPEAKEILSLASSAEVSTMGIFSDTAQKSSADSEPKSRSVKKTRSRKAITNFIDDYVPSDALKATNLSNSNSNDKNISDPSDPGLRMSGNKL